VFGEEDFLFLMCAGFVGWIIKTAQGAATVMEKADLFFANEPEVTTGVVKTLPSCCPTR
jgi:hypothetical protein